MDGNNDIKKYLENLSKNIEPIIDAGLLTLLDQIPNYPQKTYCFRPLIAEHLRCMTGATREDCDYLSAVVITDNPARAIGISLSRVNSSIDYFPWTVSYHISIYENLNLDLVRKENGDYDYELIKEQFPFRGSTIKYNKTYTRWRLPETIRGLIAFFQKPDRDKDVINVIFSSLNRLEKYFDWVIKNPESNKIRI